MFGVEVLQIFVLYFVSYMSVVDSLKSFIEVIEYTVQEYKIVVGKINVYFIKDKSVMFCQLYLFIRQF